MIKVIYRHHPVGGQIILMDSKRYHNIFSVDSLTLTKLSKLVGFHKKRLEDES